MGFGAAGGMFTIFGLIIFADKIREYNKLDNSYTNMLIGHEKIFKESAIETNNLKNTVDNYKEKNEQFIKENNKLKIENNTLKIENNKLIKENNRLKI